MISQTALVVISIEFCIFSSEVVAAATALMVVVEGKMRE